MLSETDTSSNPLDNPVWIDEQDDEEIDDTFSAEIGADDDEEEAFGLEEKSGEKIPSANTTIQTAFTQKIWQEQKKRKKMFQFSAILPPSVVSANTNIQKNL